MVEKSRETGVLVPQTSYIVVESESQFTMLQRAEKKGLTADHALEFDEFMESPAPPVVYLIPVLILLMVFHQRRRRRSSAQAV